MRFVASAPDAICAGADLRESAATAQPSRQALRAPKQGDRNAKQKTKSSTLPGRVIDDLPYVVPVAAQELDVIETYLRAVLDEFLWTTE
jgi:hypothetical protein